MQRPQRPQPGPQRPQLLRRWRRPPRGEEVNLLKGPRFPPAVADRYASRGARQTAVVPTTVEAWRLGSTGTAQTVALEWIQCGAVLRG